MERQGRRIQILESGPVFRLSIPHSLSARRIQLMANIPKNMVIGSGVVSGLVAALAVLDFVTGIPFNQMVILDVTLLLGAAGVLYMCWDSYQDFR